MRRGRATPPRHGDRRLRELRAAARNPPPPERGSGCDTQGGSNKCCKTNDGRGGLWLCFKRLGALVTGSVARCRAGRGVGLGPAGVPFIPVSPCGAKQGRGARLPVEAADQAGARGDCGNRGGEQTGGPAYSARMRHRRGAQSWSATRQGAMGRARPAVGREAHAPLKKVGAQPPGAGAGGRRAGLARRCCAIAGWAFFGTGPWKSDLGPILIPSANAGAEAGTARPESQAARPPRVAGLGRQRGARSKHSIVVQLWGCAAGARRDRASRRRRE